MTHFGIRDAKCPCQVGLWELNQRIVDSSKGLKFLTSPHAKGQKGPQHPSPVPDSSRNSFSQALLGLVPGLALSRRRNGLPAHKHRSQGAQSIRFEKPYAHEGAEGAVPCLTNSRRSGPDRCDATSGFPEVGCTKHAVRCCTSENPSGLRAIQALQTQTPPGRRTCR